MIKAIIFDGFGVLIGKGFWHTYKAAGGDLSKDGDFVDDVIERANSGKMTREEFRHAIISRLGISYEEYRTVVKREEQPNHELFDYIKNTLKPKYKIALLSNANHGVIDSKLASELRKVFDTEVISAEVGVSKPDKEIYKIALERLNVLPEEAVFVDDLEKYLLPAQELGIKTIHYNDLENFKGDLKEIL